jgi:pantothenate kinase
MPFLLLWIRDMVQMILYPVSGMEVPSSIQTMGTIKPRARVLFATVVNIWMLQLVSVAMGLMGRTATIAGQRKSGGPLDASQRTVDGEIALVVSALAHRARDVRAELERSQVYIAIAGAPGSGKSHLAQLVSDYINQNDDDNANSSAVTGIVRSIVVPMDGYHRSQKDLLAMGQMGRLIGPVDGSLGATTTYDDLMRRRGAPWTFDAHRLHADLSTTQRNGQGWFPMYDRSISDPIPHQIHVMTEHYYVFCEGNYLLALDDPEWRPLSDIWNDTWFLDVPEDVIRSRLIQRHLTTWTPAKEARFGPGRRGAITKIESSDLQNARWIRETSQHHAALLVRNG